MSPATPMSPMSDDKGLLERLLSPLADVRRGETASALLLTLLMFFLLGGYYMLKTAREVFILSESGAAVKSYASAGQALLLLVLVPAYSAFASRVNRKQLITWMPLFFASHIAVFVILVGAGVSIGIPYFLWIGIFNLMVIAQFWAFANDLYTTEQGKRLFPLIGIGSSLGAWLGSVRAKNLMESAGPIRLLIGGAIVVVICVVLARLADRLAVRPAQAKPSAPTAPVTDEKLGEGKSGFTLVFSDNYLLLIGLLMICLNVVNTSGEYLFGRYVVENANQMFGAGADTAAARGQYIGEVYAGFYGHVNLLGLVLQMFVVSRVFQFLGVGRALFIHPFIAGAGYVMMLASPSFGAIRALKTVDNAIDYSLGNTTKQALWLPTSRQAKYKAKQAVDSFFVRTGDVLQAATVYLGELAGFAIPAFAALNLALTAGWIAVAAALNSRLRARSDATGAAL